MSDELYKAFRIYTTEGLVGKNLEELYNKVKDYPADKRTEAIDAYMKVTKDPILAPMIPELSSYDLNYVSIKELYGARVRETSLATAPSEEVPVQKEEQPVVETPVAEIPKEEPAKDPTVSMAEDMTRYNKILETQKVMVPDVSAEPAKVDAAQEPELPTPSVPLQQQKNNAAMKKKLTQTGYANIVLMSIIVIIIVAILCVFIFIK